MVCQRIGPLYRLKLNKQGTIFERLLNYVGKNGLSQNQNCNYCTLILFHRQSPYLTINKDLFKLLLKKMGRCFEFELDFLLE
jgi:hypothetical protein